MNIRIGNDIRLNLTLSGIQDYNRANIKQLRCYLINTSLRDYQPEPCAITKRYPREPFPQYYSTSPYSLRNCGKPTYHVDPWNVKRHYANFGPDCYHWWPEYHGFGLKPGHFVPCDPCYGQAPLPGKCPCKGRCCGIGRRSPIDCPDPHVDEDFTFLAPSQVMNGENMIQVYFPAQDQFMCGDYKLVVVLVVYEAGWGRNNLHTYTIDKGVVFSLVDDETGMSGDLVVDVDNNHILSTNVSGLSTSYKSYTISSGNTLKVGQKDQNNKDYTIYGKVEDQVVKFIPGWQYDDLVFTSSKPSVLSVDPIDGTLRANTVEDPQTVVITVKNSKDNAICTKFTVTVSKVPFEVYISSRVMGPAHYPSVQDENFDTALDFIAWEEVDPEKIDGFVHNVPNASYRTDPARIYIKTSIPLHSSNENNILITDGVISDSIEIPMDEGKKINGYYYYSTKYTIDGGDIELSLKFE